MHGYFILLFGNHFLSILKRDEAILASFYLLAPVS